MFPTQMAGLHINVRGRGPFLYVTYGSRFLLRITYNAGKTQNFLQSLIDKEQTGSPAELK